jgi:hypothetical protein
MFCLVLSAENIALFALYTDRGYTPKQFVSLFEPGTADGQINRLFSLEFGPPHKIPRGGAPLL